MSLRDEITNEVCTCLDVNSLSAWELSGALMPLVERAVREAFRAGVNVGSSPRFDGHAPRESVDTIVARIMEGGR